MFFGTISLVWIRIVIGDFFFDGGFAVIGPYLAEVWPIHPRTTGMGAAYGFGGLGKIIGPLGLSLIVGASNIITPRATLDAIGPAFDVLRSLDGRVRLRPVVLRRRNQWSIHRHQ